jgi:hypothetical protein
VFFSSAKTEWHKTAFFDQTRSALGKRTRFDKILDSGWAFTKFPLLCSVTSVLFYQRPNQLAAKSIAQIFRISIEPSLTIEPLKFELTELLPTKTIFSVWNLVKETVTGAQQTVSPSLAHDTRGDQGRTSNFEDCTPLKRKRASTRHKTNCTSEIPTRCLRKSQKHAQKSIQAVHFDKKGLVDRIVIEIFSFWWSNKRKNTKPSITPFCFKPIFFSRPCLKAVRHQHPH